jgi:O-antigen ligase
MLASSPMDAAAVGAPATGRAAGLASLAVAALLACALFLSDGSAQGPLVALGIAALAVGVVGLALVSPRLPVAFLASLGGLAVWCALTIVWSTEPSSSWAFSNRVLAYFGFAITGVLFGSLVRDAPRVLAELFSVLLAALFGWALLAKVVPSIYPDYERVARLRSPIGYWNELALLADVAVALALWLATGRGRSRVVRAAAVGFLFVSVVALLLTYSRFGIVLAALVAAAWLALERERVESVVALIAGGVPAVAVFGVALALPGITNDGVTHAQRAHDGRLFAVAVVLGVVAAFAAAFVLSNHDVSAALRARVDRLLRYAAVAALVLAVVLVAVFAHRIWHSFTNASNVELGQGANRLGSASSSNRWGWWQEAWHAFLHHPGGGTGGGTFGLTNELHRTNPYDVAAEPHNVPLQFLTETGIVGFLLWIGTFFALAVAVVRRRRDRAVTALGLGLAAWLLHMVVDIDWSYVAVCGPLFLVGGALLARLARRPARARVVPALAAAVLVLACAYSLAAPWLAQNRLDDAESALPNLGSALDLVRTAHRYDPLSTDVLMTWASLVDANGEETHARGLYHDAVDREPLNPETWYELGAFEYQHRHWLAAYKALDRSWGLDRHGPAGVACDYLDLVRPKVTHYGRKCLGFRRPAK